MFSKGGHNNLLTANSKQVSEKCRIHCLDAACSLSWNLAAYVSYFPQESTSMTAVVEVTVAILRSKAACFVRK